ncbi:MAG: translation initiation factor IF-2 [Planctomycetota bacterium]|nr:MAG: translation initiation factor IF-2 [Planctomycetota bacterium]
MAVRIYSLAKELKVDSKDLVDLCAKAGITGKGSALASLTDEEVDRVRAFVSGGSRGEAAAKAPVEVPVAAAAVVAPPAPAAPPVIAPLGDVSVRPAPPSGPMRREDYIAPGGVTGKPRVLEPKHDKAPAEAKKKPDGEGGAKAPPLPRVAPLAPRLAPLPAGKQPVVPPKPAEPAPQKPDIKLPIDAIRASKAGSKPLSEHMKKHEEKRLSEMQKAKPGKSPSAKPAPIALPSAGEGRGKGRKGKPGEEGEGGGEGAGKLLGGRAARQLQRKRQESTGLGRRGDEETRVITRRPTKIKRTGAKTAAPRKGKVVIQLPATLRSFCENAGVPVAEAQRALLAHGAMMTINSALSEEQAEMLALEMGIEVEVRREVTLEDEMLAKLRDTADAPESLEPRPPIITFLGHVDHGKTSLLDKIIGIDVASGESGGITQHIRAYQIERNGRKISFVDTPGHEAFTEMRARGANVTDIAVLVVAADDGVMPQTEEAISHAKAAGVPIVVALNKIDLPGVNVDRIYQQLSTNGLTPAEWDPEGVEVVKTSAMTGQGLDQLLETLLLTADLHEMKANPNRAATGTCIEAHQEPGRGVVAKVVVQNGTLRVGDIFVCGETSGRVQAMYDTLRPNVQVAEAGPAMPVNVTGLDRVPGAGEHFYVMDDITEARQIAASREARSRQTTLAGIESHVTLENLFDRLGQTGQVQSLNLILRADVRGSIDAILKEIGKFKHDEVKIRVLQALVGGITEADVHLAHASDAIIIGFNVVADEAARMLAEQYKVSIRRYEIIYKLSEDLKHAVEGKLKPEQREVDLGRALVQQAFSISRVGTIAGCRVISGTVARNGRARVIRDSRIIGEYAIESLRREKDDAREVREGLECGIRLAGFNDVKPGDVLEVYRIEEVKRTLD